MNPLILVVDDEPDVEDAVSPAIPPRFARGPVHDGFRALGDAGARKVAEAEASLILILSDVNMPGMSGLDLLPKARQVRPDVPVIMITAYGDAETCRKAVERGAAGLFTKPIDFQPQGRDRPAAGRRRDEMNALWSRGQYSKAAPPGQQKRFTFVVTRRDDRYAPPK